MAKPARPTSGSSGRWSWLEWVHDTLVAPLDDGDEVASRAWVTEQIDEAAGPDDLDGGTF